MQKFTDFIKDNKTIVESLNKASREKEFEILCESKLKELGANSILDLDEKSLETFNSYVKTIKEDLSKSEVKKLVKDETKDLEKKVETAEEKAEKAEKEAEKAEKDAEKAKENVGEGKVTDEKSFRAYALEVLKKAHPKDFDQKIADKVINDLAGKVKDGDWGAAVGRLTSGLGK